MNISKPLLVTCVETIDDVLEKIGDFDYNPQKPLPVKIPTSIPKYTTVK